MAGRYYEPFRGAVEGGVGSIMCSLNKVNEEWACENEQVLTVDLKGRMNFSGWVMSDWGATHKISALMAGLDQEMPESIFMGSDVVAAEVANGTVTQAKIDDSVMRVMTALLSVGAMDRKPGSTGNAETNVTSPAHNAVARKLASAGIVLLQNGKIGAGAPPLPIAKTAGCVKHFALFGDDAL